MTELSWGKGDWIVWVFQTDDIRCSEVVGLRPNGNPEIKAFSRRDGGWRIQGVHPTRIKAVTENPLATRRGESDA